jgi:hypothetical protein
MSVYPAEIEVTARHLHELLAGCKYSEMEMLSDGKRLTANQIAESILDYGCSVVSPPEDMQLDVVKVETVQDTWSVNVPVFTTEEGRSHLTLAVTMTRTGEPLCNVEIDGLHVL